MNAVTRRGACAALGALVLAGYLGPSPAGAAGPAFSSVVVDVAPLRAKGLGLYADEVAAALDAALAESFSDRVGRGGPRLVVRIDAISLRAYAGSGVGPGGFGNANQNDYLEGEALVVAPDRRILARYPQLSAVPSSSGGAYYLPDSERRRLVALAEHFAGWLRRRID